jgi:ribosome-binding protein aMBF1 (putative translation factor)
MPVGIVTSRLGPAFSRGAELLLAYLKRTGKSQNALALMLGVKSPVVNRWAHGDQRPALRWARMLAQRCRIPLAAWHESPTTGFKLKTGTEG